MSDDEIDYEGEVEIKSNFPPVLTGVETRVEDGALSETVHFGFGVDTMSEDPYRLRVRVGFGDLYDGIVHMTDTPGLDYHILIFDVKRKVGLIKSETELELVGASRISMELLKSHGYDPDMGVEKGLERVIEAVKYGHL